MSRAKAPVMVRVPRSLACCAWMGYGRATRLAKTPHKTHQTHLVSTPRSAANATRVWKHVLCSTALPFVFHPLHRAESPSGYGSHSYCSVHASGCHRNQPIQVFQAADCPLRALIRGDGHVHSLSSCGRQCHRGHQAKDPPDPQHRRANYLPVRPTQMFLPSDFRVVIAAPEFPAK
jgi:hypothetical protein